MDYTFLNVTDSDDNDEGDTVGTSLELSNLDDDTYTVHYNIFDNAGNNESGTWSFTVDTSADFSLSPSYSPSPGVVEMSGDLDLDVTIDSESESENLDLTCYDSSDDTIDSDSGSGTDFTCTVDQDDYEDSTEDIYIEVCDQAGNCKQSGESEFTFDASDPTLSEISTDVATINSNFTVDYTALDASGIDEVRYYFNGNDDDTETVDVDSEQGSFEVDPAALDAGSHTLYVEVKDEADRWSEPKTLDFEYLPSAKPKVDITVPGRVEVTAGEDTDFNVTVENTGKLFIESVSFTTDSDLVTTESYTVSNLYPGDVTSFLMDVETKKKDMGLQTVTVSSTTLDASESLELRVKAAKSDRDRIESILESQEKRLRNLENNFTQLKEAGLSKELRKQVRNNLTSFRDKVEEARSAVDNGEYYKADATLGNVGEDYSQASETLETVREKHASAQMKNTILMAVAGLLVLGAGVGLFFWWSDEYDLHLDRVLDSDLGIGDPEGLMARIRSIFTAEEEAEEFEWNGFR